jgi:hypothetical protein
MSDPKLEEAMEISDAIFALASMCKHPMYGTMAILLALCEFIGENIAQEDIDNATELAKNQIGELIRLKVKNMEEEKKLWN